jgi:lactate permease
VLGFLLALMPLIVVFIGIVFFRRSGSEMAILALVLCFAVAVLYFRTDALVAGAAALYGILKSFGITIAVVGTMLMIFLMKEVGALDTISAAIKRVATTPEQQAVFIGIGFGTFVSGLGVVTPSLFPPLLVAMGFSPFAAVSISALGYDATTSFALLAIPVTLPADIFNLDPHEFAFKISLFLPVVSVLISFAMLWVIGGMASVRKGALSALLSGLTIGLACLGLSYFRMPVMITGVLAGLLTMLVLYGYQRATGNIQKSAEPLAWKSLLVAMSPWLVLIALALTVSVPPVTDALAGLDGTSVKILGKGIDFDVFIQIYTWIFVAIAASLLVLRPTKEQLKGAFAVWRRRIWGPVLAYSLFFSVAYIMAWSAMSAANGVLVPSSDFDDYNMNMAVGSVLADVFGTKFVFVAVWLGLFGAVVGGSETGSNVLFYPIQRRVSTDIGLSDRQFLTVYSAHAVAGGVASAITPSKINNAVATIKAPQEVESQVMRKHMVIVLGITLLVGFLTALFVWMAI